MCFIIMDHQSYRTKLANQRTYLAYIRTGFAISVFAKIYKKVYIVYYGIFMLFMSTFQYLVINNNIDEQNDLNNKYIDFIPVIYGVIAIIIIYMQFTFK